MGKDRINEQIRANARKAENDLADPKCASRVYSEALAVHWNSEHTRYKAAKADCDQRGVPHRWVPYEPPRRPPPTKKQRISSPSHDEQEYSSSNQTTRQNTTNTVANSTSVSKTASIELSHETSHESRSGASIGHIKTTTIKKDSDTEEKVIEVHTYTLRFAPRALRATNTRFTSLRARCAPQRTFESVEVAESKKAILKQKVKVIQKDWR